MYIDILIDFAYNNCILVQNNDAYIVYKNLEDVFLQYDCNFNLFIVYGEGSYTGIRKALVLSIIQLYVDRIRVYASTLIQYLTTYGTNIGVVINKHIWYKINNIEGVTSINTIPQNIEVCNINLPYKCKVIDLNQNYLWNNRYTIFTLNTDIIYPKYLDIFGNVI